jgi:hypothetical protein
MNIIKEFIVGAFMSLSKVEQQQILTQVKRESDGDGTSQETPIRKQEIKIISSERFNQLMEGMDRAYAARYEEKFSEKRKHMGIEYFMMSFNNMKFEPSAIEQASGLGKIDFSFKTSNLLNHFSKSVVICGLSDENVELGFYMDIEGKNRDFSDLEYFYLIQNGIIYSFIDLIYLGERIHDSGESVNVFKGTLIRRETEKRKTTESVMRKEDLIDPNTFYIKPQNLLDDDFS